MIVARVLFELPALLDCVTGGRRTWSVDARSLEEALQALYRECPPLYQRLCDESGAFRPHVLCLHNRVNTRWLSSLDVPVSDGDRVVFLQAVSGG